jgi:hypothetical protein
LKSILDPPLWSQIFYSLHSFEFFLEKEGVRRKSIEGYSRGKRVDTMKYKEYPYMFKKQVLETISFL